MFQEYAYIPTPGVPELKDLPNDKWQIEKVLLDLYMREENIRAVAHWVWEKAGCPDGEQRHWNSMWMKVRDMHWLTAKMLLELTADIDADTLWWAKICGEPVKSEPIVNPHDGKDIREWPGIDLAVKCCIRDGSAE